MTIDLEKDFTEQLSKLENQSWDKLEINFDFAPTINKGYSGIQLFHDKNGQRIRMFLIGDKEFHEKLYRFIYEANQSGNVNRIAVTAKKSTTVEIKINVCFATEIVDDFEKNLPKSMRGKTVPWWKNPEETNSLYS